MFSEVVRAHRHRLGLSQQDLADKCGLTVRGLRKIESGQIATPRPVTVRLLADAFGLAAADRDQFCAAAHRPTGDPKQRVTTGPALLPPDVAGFVGRAESLQQLDALLVRGADQPTAVVVTAVAGTAGIGKTTLAVHWAHRVRARFPDGQLYINLRGFDPSGVAMDPAEAIRRFLDALAVPADGIPADPGAQADLYRTRLADKTVLIVLDNARDAQQVRPLLPGAPGCLVLITGRNQLTSLVAAEGAHQLPLDLLTPAESRELLERRLGAARVHSEPNAVDELITFCAGLPLALAIVAANAATHPNLPLIALADRLRHRRDRLNALATGDVASTDLRAVFSWSYQALGEDAARLFRLLGLHPGPDISTAAAASLAAVPIARIRSLLNELHHAHLVTEHTPGRFTLHDLLRAYAAEQAQTVDTDLERHAAAHRLLDHYLHTAHTAERLLSSTGDAITLPAPQPGVVPEELADHDHALAWFTAERAVLLAAVEHAAAVGSDAHTWQLALTLDTYLDRRGLWHEWTAICHAALAAAQRHAEPTAQAQTHRTLARAYNRLGRFDDAYAELQHALDLFGRAGDLVGQAYTHRFLANVRERQDRYPEALDHARHALELFGRAGDRVGQASALNGVGWHYALIAEYDQALTYCQQALTLLEESGDRPGQGATWDSLGYAHYHLGRYDDAVTCYRHALDLAQDLGDRRNEAGILTHLGNTHHAAGKPAAARHAWQRAMSILDELQHPDAELVRARLCGLGRRSPAPEVPDEVGDARDAATGVPRRDRDRGQHRHQ